MSFSRYHYQPKNKLNHTFDVISLVTCVKHGEINFLFLTKYIYFILCYLKVISVVII